MNMLSKLVEGRGKLADSKRMEAVSVALGQVSLKTGLMVQIRNWMYPRNLDLY